MSSPEYETIDSPVENQAAMSPSPPDTEHQDTAEPVASPQPEPEEQQDVFTAEDSDSDVEISAAIEAVTKDIGEGSHDSNSPPVKQKRQLLSDSDLEEEGEKSQTEQVRDEETSPPTKKTKLDGESFIDMCIDSCS